MSSESNLNNVMFLDTVINDIVIADAMANNPRVVGASPSVPFVVADPGCGKTETLYGSAKEIKWGVLTTHLSTQTIEELTGLPDFIDIKVNEKSVKGTRWSYPDVISQLYDLSQKHEGVFWFMDDFHLASPENQKFCFQLFTDYALKGYAVPDNVHIVLAGNPTAKAGARNMLSAISNRVAFYPTKANLESWMIWAEKNGVHPIIRKFLDAAAYKKFFHQAESIKAWASPRSWVKFSRALTNDENRQGKNLQYNFISYRAEAHVGSEAASKFGTYWKLYSKVDTKLLFDKEIIDIPDRGSQEIYIYVIASAYEYVNRYIQANEANNKKETDRLEDLMAKLINEVVSIQKDMSLVLVKEMSLVPKREDKCWDMLTKPLEKFQKIDNGKYKDLTELIVEMFNQTKS